MSELAVPKVNSGQRLDVSRCPVGQLSRWMITLVEDGLGQPISVPMMVARGSGDGPVFGIVAALHGNELNGLGVLHKLFEQIDPQAMKGTLVAVLVANVPGLLRNQRGFNDGADLNHLMPGIPDGNMSEAYAYRLIERIASQFEYFVDLHTASFGCVNALYVRADLRDPTAATMAELQWPQIILNDRPSDYTLRGAVAEHGVPSITVEICDPFFWQPVPIQRTVEGLLRMLAYFGMIQQGVSGVEKTPAGMPPIKCDRSTWVYTDRGGLLSVFAQVTQRVRAGDLIARQANVFGDIVREYTCPRDGVVIGHNISPVGQTGSRIVHLGYNLP